MTKRTLLCIVEQGGYPIYSGELAEVGCDVVVAKSMRKALALLDPLKPDIILAEFNFGPKYGDRISNLEPLLARLQNGHPDIKVIVFLEREYRHHLEQLRTRFSVFDALFYPIQRDSLIDCVRRASDDA